MDQPNRGPGTPKDAAPVNAGTRNAEISAEISGISPINTNTQGVDSGSTTADSGAGRQHLREQASQIKDDTKQKAQGFIKEQQQKAQGMLEEQKQKGSEHLGKLADALHQTSSSLQQNNEEQVARYAGMAADGLQRLSSSLREQDVNSLLRQTESLARRQPALFVGGAVALGFMLSRFLKSSSEHQENASVPHDHSLVPTGMHAESSPDSTEHMTNQPGI